MGSIDEALLIATRIQRSETQRLIKHFKGSTSLESFSSAVSSVNENIDNHFSSFCSRRSIKLACMVGCAAYCCLYRVVISPPEAFHIKKFIQNTTDDKKLQIIKERIHSAAIKAKGLTPAQFIKTRLHCPFLEENQCLIYSVRPMMCRVFHSTDLSVCTYTDKHPGQLAMDSRVPVLFFGSIAHRDAFLVALKKVGLDGNIYEMCQTLDVAFSNAAALKEWRKGKQIFPHLPPDTTSFL